MHQILRADFLSMFHEKLNVSSCLLGSKIIYKLQKFCEKIQYLNYNSNFIIYVYLLFGAKWISQNLLILSVNLDPLKLNLISISL